MLSHEDVQVDVSVDHQNQVRECTCSALNILLQYSHLWILSIMFVSLLNKPGYRYLNRRPMLLILDEDLCNFLIAYLDVRSCINKCTWLELLT